ncbi:MAG: hypothetical protein K2Q97_16225, partial [Burkholderiaceae bacterium]|nr:hypothetical protein [Burkholderiaceae bacterium]
MTASPRMTLQQAFTLVQQRFPNARLVGDGTVHVCTLTSSAPRLASSTCSAICCFALPKANTDASSCSTWLPRPLFSLASRLFCEPRSPSCR